MSLKDKFLNSWMVDIVYKGKFYFNVAMSQIGWLTNKLPELMAVLYLLEKIGITIEGPIIIPLALTAFVLGVAFGWVWKFIGLYDAEIYIQANKNPVQLEMLQAARKINGGKTDGRKI